MVPRFESCFLPNDSRLESQLSPDTKSIVQTYTFCTTQDDKTDKTERCTTASERLNHRVTDTFLAERFATALEAEPRDCRHILNTIIR